MRALYLTVASPVASIWGRHTPGVLLALAILIWAPSHTLAEQVFVEGRDYDRVQVAKQARRMADDQIEVREFFWYACPHCYNLEPIIEKWKETKAPVVNFITTPAVLGEDWVVHARIYYTLEQMGRLDLHQQVFRAIHQHNKRLASEKAAAEYLNSVAKLSKEDFLRVYRSLNVDLLISQAVRLGKHYVLRRVPVFIVNDRYEVHPGHTEGSGPRMLEVVNHLVKLEAERMKLPADKAMPLTPPAEKPESSKKPSA